MSQPVTLTYTNWRGETAERTITPTGRMIFDATEWHPEPQWLIEAHDARSGEVRLFALTGFGKAAPQATPGPVEADADLMKRLEGMSDLYWRMRALHDARMRLIDMVVQQERARNGKGKAWNGTFYAEQLALLSRKDLEPCMECRGSGCQTDPETGPGMCQHCSGDGVFPSKTEPRQDGDQ